MGRSRWSLIGCAVLAAAASLLGGGTARATPPAPARLETITIPAPAGAIAPVWLSYAGQPRANVVLPKGYDSRKRYPLLVLLHGVTCNYDWLRASSLLKVVDGLNAIVVTPEGGNGWYTDWWNGGKRNGPDWESYELDQVLPTILSRYPILAQRRYHALAGISMGGLGAAYLGGRLPGFFGSVATLSGFVNPGFYGPVTSEVMGMISGAARNGDTVPNPVAGPANGFYAKGHDPVRLAGNLRWTRVFQSTGTGLLSGSDLTAIRDGDAAGITENAISEGLVIAPMNRHLHAALTAAHVDVTFQQHAGGHDIGDFAAELRAMLAWGLFKPVPSQPSSWTNDTVAAAGRLWNVGYTFDRPPTHVVRFHESGATLSVSAAGTPVTLTTGRCTIHTATPATVRLARHPCP